jgi:hypothetical protein
MARKRRAQVQCADIALLRLLTSTPQTLWLKIASLVSFLALRSRQMRERESMRTQAEAAASQHVRAHEGVVVVVDFGITADARVCCSEPRAWCFMSPKILVSKSRSGNRGTWPCTKMTG